MSKVVVTDTDEIVVRSDVNNESREEKKETNILKEYVEPAATVVGAAGICVLAYALTKTLGTFDD